MRRPTATFEILRLLRAHGLGDLDVLGTLADEVEYGDLVHDVVSLNVEDFEVPVLGLGRLIEVKERANREKDRAVLPLLRSTLERAKRGG